MNSVSPRLSRSPEATHTSVATDHRLAPASDEYVPLSVDSLLVFCQTRLRELDGSIIQKMKGQKELVTLQGRISNINATLQGYSEVKEGGDANVAFDNADKVAEASKMLDAAAKDARALGNEDLAKSLEAAKAKVQLGPDGKTDNKVTKEDLKEISTMLDSALATCRSGAEMSMIELQSLVSQRATQLQLTTGMMNSMNEGAKAIAGNIGR